MTKQYGEGEIFAALPRGIHARRWAFAAAVLLCVCLFTAAPAATDVTVTDLTGLNANISNAQSGVETIILIGADIPINGTDAITSIGSSKNITLKPAGRDVKIYQTEANTSTDTGMFTVSGGNLTITGNGGYNLTPLDGNTTAVPDNKQSLVYVETSGNMKNAFRILFETNGGSFISPVTGLSSGDVIVELPPPTKDGYTFGGWYRDEDCTQSWSFSEGIPGDMTLYARWTDGGNRNDNGSSTRSGTAATASPGTGRGHRRGRTDDGGGSPRPGCGDTSGTPRRGRTSEKEEVGAGFVLG